MIDGIEAYKNEMVELATKRHNMQTAEALAYGKDTSLIDEVYEKFMKNMKNEAFVRRLYFEYLKRKDDGGK